jgi:hypothetical protein
MERAMSDTVISAIILVFLVLAVYRFNRGIGWG